LINRPRGAVFGALVLDSQVFEGRADGRTCGEATLGDNKEIAWVQDKGIWGYHD